MEKLALLHKTQIVGSILTRYIVVHNEVFRFRWRRLLPLGNWFEAIDFHGHLVTLKSMEEELRRIRLEVEDSSCALAETLAAYTGALEEAISELRRICAGLDAKRVGSDTYPWSEYRLDHDNYKAKVRDYQAVGAELNKEIQFLKAGIGR